ncbi:MAG: hypothetical protein ACFCU1_05010 [Sumerlaeia bacterium]
MKNLSVLFAFSILCTAPLCSQSLPTASANGGPQDFHSQRAVNPAVVNPLEALEFTPLEFSTQDAPTSQTVSVALELGFEGASFMPIDTQIKTRSRLQEDVLIAMINNGQPSRAYELSTQIMDWRRGSVFAELALHRAKAGDVDNAEKLIELAQEISTLTEDWRSETIQTKCAQASVIIGNSRASDGLELSVDSHLEGVVNQTQAELATDEDFDSQVAVLDGLVFTGNFDVHQNVVESYLILHRKFYADAERRTALEEKIDRVISKFPANLYIKFTLKLAETKAAEGDADSAMKSVEVAKAYLFQEGWEVHNQYPLIGKLVETTHRIGQPEAALQLADAAWDSLIEQREDIASMWLGQAYRPMAEAYAAIGKPARALNVLKLSFEDGIKNPNIRPRSTDFVANCITLAELDFQGTEELLPLVQRIHHELDPAK